LRVIIVGGGKLVYFLGRLFISSGCAVSVINRDAGDSREIARELKALVIAGDGSDPRRLEEAQAMRADAVVAVTPSDADNLAICQIARRRFEVPRTVALVNDPDNENVFKQLGVTSVFNQTKMISSLIQQEVSLQDIVSLLPLKEGKVNATEITIRKEHRCESKSLSEISLPKGTLLSVILRGDSVIIPRGDTKLLAGDKAILLSTPQSQGPAIRTLTGER
jgi:trk system potassium uptake protein TrkA